MEKEENILLDKHLPTFSMIKRSFGYIKPEIKTPMMHMPINIMIAICSFNHFFL